MAGPLRLYPRAEEEANPAQGAAFVAAQRITASRSPAL